MKKFNVAAIIIMSMFLLNLLLFQNIFISQSQAASQKITVTFMNWANPGERERFIKFNEYFMKKNPDIQIKYITVSSDYDYKLLTMLASNSAPDVFYVGDGAIRQAIKSGKLEPLNSYFGKGKVILKKEDFDNVLFRIAEYKGKIYGIPVDCNPMVIHYNMSIISKLGLESPQKLYDAGKWTWDEFYKIAKKAREKGYYGYVLDSGWWGPIMPWFATVYKDGREPVLTDLKNKKSLLDRPEYIEVIKFLVKGIKDRAFTYAGSLPQGQTSDGMFLSGRLVFGAWGRWQVPNFKKAKFSWDVVPYPTKYGNKNAKTYIAQAVISMSSSSKHKEQAWRFIASFTNQDGQKFRLEGQGNAVPAIKGIDYLVTQDKVPAHAEYYVRGRKNGFPIDFYIQEAGANSTALQELEKIFVLKADSEQQMKKIARYITQQYQKNIKGY